MSAMEGYLQAANRASRGEDLAGFRSLFSDSCGLCMTQYTNFMNASAQGQIAEGTLYEEWKIDVQSHDDRLALITTRVNTGDVTLRAGDGSVVATFPREVGVNTAWTLNAQAGGGWTVVSAQDLP